MLQLLESPQHDIVVNVTETTVGVSWSSDNKHLLLSDIQLVPGFTVTCNASNIHAYLLTTASVSVLRKLPFAFPTSLVHFTSFVTALSINMIKYPKYVPDNLRI